LLAGAAFEPVWKLIALSIPSSTHKRY
jgi:hypothetical protein